MSALDILNDCKIVDVLDYASANADRTSAAVDTTGYEGCAFVVKFAAIAAGAVTDIYAVEDDASGLGTKAALAGTSQTVADDDDNQIFVIDIKRPKKKYLALEINKDGTNATAECAFAILYGASSRPTNATSQADVNGESFVSPSAGTK